MGFMVTVNQIGGGSAGDPEGSVNVGLNLGHEVGDGTFLNAVMHVVFDPEISD